MPGTLIAATAGGVPVAGHRREGPDGLGGHRHGRHPGHRALSQGRGGSHLEERLRLPPAWRRGARIRASAWPCCCAPGNAGSNTFTDHKEVLAAALRQVPSRFRRMILVRVDGAGASHDLVEHMLSLNTKRKKVLFTTRVDDHRSRRGRHREDPRGRVEARNRPGRHRRGRQRRRGDHAPAGQGRRTGRTACGSSSAG